MKHNPRRSAELQNKARALLQQDRVPDALEAATKACKEDPRSPDAWFTLAAIHARRQDFRGVAECCLRAIKHQPGNPTAHFNLGLARQSMGDLRGAIEAYRDAIRLQPGYTAAQLNLAVALIDLGDAEEGLVVADGILSTAPCMPEAIGVRGNALLRLGKTHEALEWFETKLVQQANVPQLLHGAARCQLALGNVDAARRLLDQATQAAPGYAPAWVELGTLARQAEDFRQAAQYYERATRLQPTRENRFNLAHCLYASEHIEPARRLYHELLEQYPDDPVIHNNLGRLYERIGKVDESISHLRRAVQLRPGDATPHCNLGRILLGTGRLEDAMREYDAAIAIDPDHYEGHFGRGQVYVELGDAAAAIESFRAALALKPELSPARHYIAALGGSDASGEDSLGYVADLFDHFAEKFDQDLIVGLKYKTPEVLFQALQPLLGSKSGGYDILDLGCGTGLCGPLFRPCARRLVGVDLSSQMIEKARERGLYDEFAVEDIEAFMRRAPGGYDLVIAADVFVYIGDLAAVFAAVRAALREAGLFAFSTELCDGDGFRLRSSGRHAHAKDYINRIAAEQGFTSLHEQDCDLRMEFSKPVKGTLYVFRA